MSYVTYSLTGPAENTECHLYVPRGVGLLRTWEVVIDEARLLTPTRIRRTCFSQSRRMLTARPSKIAQWAADGDTMSLGIDGHLDSGEEIAVSLADFVRPSLLDRGPAVRLHLGGDSERSAEVIELVEPLLDLLAVRQGCIMFGDDAVQPYFPTVEPAGISYARYDPQIYDRFVIGYHNQLVWVGPALRDRLPAQGRRVADEQGWFAPTPELLGETWPTVAATRPFMELIQNGVVIPWTTEAE